MADNHHNSHPQAGIRHVSRNSKKDWFLPSCLTEKGNCRKDNTDEKHPIERMKSKALKGDPNDPNNDYNLRNNLHGHHQDELHNHQNSHHNHNNTGHNNTGHNNSQNTNTNNQGQSQDPKMSNPDESYSQFFLKNLRQLREESVLIDISFTQSNTVIKGHRVILAALSPVLRGIFTKKQQTMSADHISPEALSCLVNFVYKKEAQLDAGSLHALYKTSELLSIRQVQSMTLRIMDKLGIQKPHNSQHSDFNNGHGNGNSSPKSNNNSFQSEDISITPENITTENGETIYAYKSQTIPGLLQGLELIRDKGLFTDVTLIAQDEKTEIRLACHRIVLASASQVFRAIMTSVQTQDILLRRVEPNALRALIEYLYTGKLTITSDNVVPLLKAGHRFGCPFVARATGAVLDEICQLNGKTGSGKDGSINFTQYSEALGVTTLGDVRPDSIITLDNWLDVYRLSSIYNLTPLRLI